jgi:hypothetical protein
MRVVAGVMARPFLYRCPLTGSQVQGTLEGEPGRTDEGGEQYEAMECVACRRFHFVNVATLKLLSEDIGE